MHHNPIPGHEPATSAELARALLGLIVCDHPGLWSVAELDRALTPAGGDGFHVEDAVADLYAAGLIHRCNEFVFATRAAHEAERLAS